MRIVRAGCLLAIPVFGLAGCGTDDRFAPRGEAWSVALEPTTSIGEVEGDSVYLFQRIVAADLLSDGRIVVADAGLSVLRVFDADGRFLRQMGRAGNGPGEFAGLRGIAIATGDTILAWDAGGQRLTWFTPDGTLVRTAPVSPPAGVPGHPDVLVGPLDDGAVALARTAGGVGDPPDLGPDRMTVEIFGPGGEFRGGMPPLDGMIRHGRGPIAFSPFPFFAVLDDMIYFLNGATPSALLVGAGDIVRADGGEPVDRRVALPETIVDVDAAWVGLEEQLRADDAGPMAAMQLEQLDEQPRSSVVPFVSGLLVDERARIWTKPYDPAVDALWLRGGSGPSGGSWWVVDADGEVVATVDVPDGLQPIRVRGERVLGLSVDDLGIQRVSVHAIEGGS